MTPTDAIDSLDRALATNGQDVVLQRIIGAANQAVFNATCRAFVRNYQPHDLAGGIIQGDSHVVLSPTDIKRSQWPGPQAVSLIDPKVDTRVPKKNDKLVQAGKVRNIEAATPFYMASELVRIELVVRG